MKSSVKRHTKPENKFLPSVSVDLKNIFVEKFGFTKEEIRKLLNLALSKGGEFSEVFFEYRVINSVHMEEDIIKESSESIDMGVGVRVIQGIRTGYAYTSDLTFDQIRGAVLSAATIASSGHRYRAFRLTEHNPAHQVYDLEMPVFNLPILKKIEIIEKAYTSAKDYHPSIHQIQVHWTDEMQWISVFNSEGLSVSDIRPQVRLTAVSTARSGQNDNTGTASGGGRTGL